MLEYNANKYNVTNDELNKLKKYNWGFGIEHEMHIYHTPKQGKQNITDFILFDSYDVVQRIYDLLNDNEKKIIDQIPYEISGRKCSGQYVVEPTPILMPEFITFNPFCSIDKKRSLLNMILEVEDHKETFYKILKKYDPETKSLIKYYGKLTEHPFGMSRNIKYPMMRKRNKYILNKKDTTDYNGSYHLTFTLPHTKMIPNKTFIKIHQNFANQLQWLEPLMLTAYFSGDELSPGSNGMRVRGSFRVMMTGWGNLAGSDIRLFGKGIGRYSKTKTYWRDNLHFKDLEKLKLCYPPNPLAVKEGAITSLSSNFRTFGSTDPRRPEHRESGIKMTPPNGVEFRIFDHFPDVYLDNLVLLVSLVAENSRLKETIDYVYENKIWIDTIQNIMKCGYRAELSYEYIDLLREKLDLKIDSESIIAFDVFEVIYDELWKKNIDGKWSKIFHCMNKPIKPDVPEINKESWQFSFAIMLNKNKKTMMKFNILLDTIKKKEIVEYNDLKKTIEQIMGKKWKNDSYDIAYFLHDYFKAEIIKNKNGTIDRLLLKEKVNSVTTMNKIITDAFVY
jgi:hypothetical protein